MNLYSMESGTRLIIFCDLLMRLLLSKYVNNGYNSAECYTSASFPYWFS